MATPVELNFYIETVLALVPLIYAFGYFKVDNKLAYGVAGLFATGTGMMFGFGLMRNQNLGGTLVIMNSHLLGWVVLGTFISMFGAFRGLVGGGAARRAAAESATQTATREAAGENPAPGRVKNPGMFYVAGRVYDSKNKRPISGATVTLVGTPVSAQTDTGGMYLLECTSTSAGQLFGWIISVEAPGYTRKLSNEVLKGGRNIRAFTGEKVSVDFPLDKVPTEEEFRGDIRIEFTDRSGNRVEPAIVRRSETWTAKITATETITFDKPAGRTPSTGEEDYIILYDEDHNVLLDSRRNTRSVQFRYQGLKTILVTGVVPTKDASGRAIPADRDIHVTIEAHLNAP